MAKDEFEGSEWRSGNVFGKVDPGGVSGYGSPCGEIQSQARALNSRIYHRSGPTSHPVEKLRGASLT